jgi:rod shape-determining protein MreD
MYKVSKGAYIIPSFLLVFLVIFGSSYNSTLYFAEYTPFYEIIIVFYWRFYLPQVLPLLLLIFFGIFKDYFMMSPMGMSSVSFVLISLLAQKEASIIKSKSLVVIFLIFTLNIFIVSIVKIIFLHFYMRVNISFLLNLFSIRVLSTILVYIPIHCALGIIRNKVSSQEDGH